ncbi:MAG: glycosyltransferase family 4 protein [Chloroflexi bacterium]|nr:glycosyltransferase family 4 protein [Chloroflexota bacterium]
MKRLLVFNLAVDVDDPILGFTTVWINRLAEHFSHVDVITMRSGRLAVADNVRVWSVGKERGYNEPRRLLIFYTTLLMLLLTRRYAACFAHMMPLFALLAAPLLVLFGVPQTLWYTHRQSHRVLRWATRVVRRAVTAASDSFPVATPKLRVIGHGIDTEVFSPGSAALAHPSEIAQVARLMPIKNQRTLIRALGRLHDRAARAVFVGGVPPEQSRRYAEELERLAQEVGVGSRVQFCGDRNRADVVAQLRGSAVAVNLSPPGLFDKAALESIACAVPTVVSSAAFASLLGEHDARLRIDDPEDDAALADRLDALLSIQVEERRALGMQLRERVVAAHGLDGLIERLVAILLSGEIGA